MNDQEHKCQCDFRIRILGDGCRYCHPQKYIDRLYDTMDGMIHSIIVKLNGAGYYEAATMLRQQQDLLGGYHEQALNDSKATSKLMAEMQAEIEELKAKLNKYHLKEDLDRNLDLIYGKEFIK